VKQYRQITSGERYAIAALRRQGLSVRAIARDLGRSPSTVSREVARNVRADGGYRAFTACERTRARRRRSRRNTHFGAEEWALVEQLIALDWSPEQVAGWLRLHELLRISYETIYVYVWRDKAAGGGLWAHMRQAGKKRRKRYGAHDSRRRLAGKRHISERPAEVETRKVVGHWEIDTVKGDDQARHSVVTLVERKTGYLEVGKLVRHNAAEAARRHHRTDREARRTGRDRDRRQRQRVPLLRAGRGGDRDALLLRDPAPLLGAGHEREHERAHQAVPAQAQEHGARHAGDCDAIAAKLNTRPRKRLGYRTPEECYAEGR